MTQFFNTLTRQKEAFTPADPQNVKIYGCGPTVYDFIHVGNARNLAAFDVLRRHLRHVGYGVTFVQNYTDIDDKVIAKANAEGVTYDQIAARYIAEFETDSKGLNVSPPDMTPLATEHIADILAIIKKLEQNGLAYPAKDGVYYRVRKLKDYGKLSHQPPDDLESGARVEIDTGKEDPLDFALWKFAKPGEPRWDSPWGAGRPGWHIECSAMSTALLGDTIDIHCGGQDLIFPHHENEIAQSEGATGKPLARYWLHNGFLNIDGSKMSKSLNNFFTLRSAAAEYGYDAVRFALISAHYRSPMNYTQDLLESARAAVERIKNARRNIAHILKNAAEEGDPRDYAQYTQRFNAALDDDLNTAEAAGVLFEMIREINTHLQDNPSKRAAESAETALNELLNVLGMDFPLEAGADAEIENLIAERANARKSKNWAKSDEIREKLKQIGVIVEDTPQGQKWKRA